jgi:hypothetical protein
MGQHIYRGEILPDFLLRALPSYRETVDGEERGFLRLPGRVTDNVTDDEIDAISIEPRPSQQLALFQTDCSRSTPSPL